MALAITRRGASPRPLPAPRLPGSARPFPSAEIAGPGGVPFRRGREAALQFAPESSPALPRFRVLEDGGVECPPGIAGRGGPWRKADMITISLHQHISGGIEAFSTIVGISAALIYIPLNVLVFVSTRVKRRAVAISLNLVPFVGSVALLLSGWWLVAFAEADFNLLSMVWGFSAVSMAACLVVPIAVLVKHSRQKKAQEEPPDTPLQPPDGGGVEAGGAVG